MKTPYNVNRLALWLHRRFFNRRHFWVTMKPGTEYVPGVWCFECGTIKGHEYQCVTESVLRRTCEPFGDYPNCAEVLGALMFVHSPDVTGYVLCAWCEKQVRAGLSRDLYFDSEEG